MKIAIASDHAGYDLKEIVKKYLEEKNHLVFDYGTNDGHISVDYPDFARLLAMDVVSAKYQRGILICGTGIGMSIAANRINGIRAALCEDEERAELARKHNNSNVLVLAGRFIPPEKAKRIVDVWLHTEFEDGRHSKRIEKIDKYNV